LQDGFFCMIITELLEKICRLKDKEFIRG